MKHARARAIVGLISISAGLLFAILPWRWIELTWGVDIDASSGLVEFLLAAIPLALGTVVLVGAPHCSIRSAQHADPTKVWRIR